MDHLIRLIAESVENDIINEADEPKRRSGAEDSAGREGEYAGASVGGSELSSFPPTDEQREAFGSPAPEGIKPIPGPQASSRYEGTKYKTWGDIEDAKNEREYHASRNAMWSEIDQSLKILEQQHHAYEQGKMPESDLVADDLPNFRSISSLVKNSLYFDLVFPRALDLATRESSRRWLELGRGHIFAENSSRAGGDVLASIEEFGKTTEQEFQLISVVKLDRFFKDIGVPADTTAAEVRDKILKGTFSIPQLTQFLREIHASKYPGIMDEIELKNPQAVDRVKISSDQDIFVESMTVHFHNEEGRGGTTSNHTIKVNQEISGGTYSSKIRIPNPHVTLLRIQLNCKFPGQQSALVSIVGLGDGADEKHDDYFTRLMGIDKLKKYLTRPDSAGRRDKLLQPGVMGGPGEVDTHPLSRIYPQGKYDERDAFMKRIADFKMQVIDELRGFVITLFDERFSKNYEEYKENKRKVNLNKARYVQNPQELPEEADGTIAFDSLLTFLRNVKVDFFKSVENIDLIELLESKSKQLNIQIDVDDQVRRAQEGDAAARAALQKMFSGTGSSTKMPDISKHAFEEGAKDQLEQMRQLSKKLVDSQEDFQIGISANPTDLLEYDVSGELGRSIYIGKIEELLSGIAHKLSKISSSFILTGINNYRCENLKDVGSIVTKAFQMYDDHMAEGLQQSGPDSLIANKWSGLTHGSISAKHAEAGIGGKVKIILRPSSFKANITANGKIEPDIDEDGQLDNMWEVGSGASPEMGDRLQKIIDELPTIEKWWPHFSDENGSPRTGEEEVTLQFDIGKNTLYAPISLNEIYCRDLESNLKNVYIVSAQDSGEEVTSSSKFLSSINRAYDRMSSIDVKEFISAVKSNLRKGAPDDYSNLENVLDQLKQLPDDEGGLGIGLKLDISVLSKRQTGIGNKTPEQYAKLAREKIAVRKMIRFAIEHHINKYQSGATKFSGFFVRSSWTLVYNPQNIGPTKRPRGERQKGPWNWEHNTSTKYPVFYQMWGPGAQQVTSDSIENIANKKWPDLEHLDPNKDLVFQYSDEHGQLKQATISAKDYYEKQLNKQTAIKNVKPVGTTTDRKLYEKPVIAYTDPKYDNDPSGVKCLICSHGEKKPIFHMNIESLDVGGSNSYPKDGEWDTNNDKVSPHQLVRINYNIGPMVDQNEEEGSKHSTKEYSVKLRRHEISERKLLDRIEPSPSIVPIEDNAVFIWIPDRDKFKLGQTEAGKFVSVSTKIKKGRSTKSDYEQWRWAQQKAAAKAQAGKLAEDDKWQLHIETPENPNESIDFNGTTTLQRNEYIDPDTNLKTQITDAEYSLSDDLDKTLSDGTPSNDIFKNNETGGIAEWIFKDEYGDKIYLVLPPVNDRFKELLGSKAFRGLSGKDFRGYSCDHCGDETGFLPLKKTSDERYIVDFPYVRNNGGKAELTYYEEIPLSFALKKASELWYSHKDNRSLINYPSANMTDLEVNDSDPNGFKHVVYRNKDVPITQIFSRAQQLSSERDKNEGMGAGCVNLIIRGGNAEVCGQTPARFHRQPESIYSVPNKNTGRLEWRTAPPSIAIASLDKQKHAATKDYIKELESVQNIETARNEQKYWEGNSERQQFCQSCFMANFPLFPDYLVTQMNDDLDAVIKEAKYFYDNGENIKTEKQQTAWKITLDSLLREFAIKWVSDKSFWGAWEDYIKKLDLRGVTRDGLELPDYITKFLNREHDKLQKAIMDMVQNKNGYIHDILHQIHRDTGSKPAYVAKLERIHGMISGWAIYSNTYKSMNADRSSKGTFGELHYTIPVNKTMTKTERDRMSHPSKQFQPNRSYISRDTFGATVPEGVEYAILDGFIGEEMFLNGLTGIIEGKTAEGQIIVRLDPNALLEDTHIQVTRGEFILISEEITEDKFATEHEGMIREEHSKILDDLATIKQIGKFVSESLYY